MLISSHNIPNLPPPVKLETVAVLKALASANRTLAELKGRALTIPNQGILIDTLALQEAKVSSEIENLVTTQDELFQADLGIEKWVSGPVKEVTLYRDALILGYHEMKKSGGLITNNTVIEMYRVLKKTTGGFRVVPGTALKNEATGEIVHVPPQDAREIKEKMFALEFFINTDDFCALDPLIKMAIIHHQFESIHPFLDGNGRIGRILNALYLTRTGLLDSPILYLSRYITESKSRYYYLLQKVRTDGVWEDWVVYMLAAVEETAKTTIRLIDGMREQMVHMKIHMRRVAPNLYSQDLLNNLFRHPYTRAEFVVQDLGVSRVKAVRQLEQLARNNFVARHKCWGRVYYINTKLINLFLEVSGER